MGKMLKGKAARYTSLAALFAGGGAYLADITASVFGVEFPIPREGSLAITAAGAISAFGLGNFFTAISYLFAGKKSLVAAANLGNLTEDAKKLEKPSLIQDLWDGVVQYDVEHRPEGDVAKRLEVARALSPETLEKLSVSYADLEKLVSSCTEEDGFHRAASFVLEKPLPQDVEDAIAGINLQLVEDYFDGALFDANDCKVCEQYLADVTLNHVGERVGRSFSEKLAGIIGCSTTSLLFDLTMNKISIQTGKLITAFNAQFSNSRGDALFDAQHFLWHNQDLDEVVERKYGKEARETLQRERAELIRSVFSADRTEARNHVYLLFGKDYERAMGCRLRFDPEFAAGWLEQTPDAENDQVAEAACRDAYSRKEIARQTERAKRILQEADLHTAGWDNTARLAARIAASVGDFDLRKKEERELVQRRKYRYAYELNQVRIHYTLAKNQLFTYFSQIDALGGFI
ncbi:MAG: hypothetical protein R6U98_17080 [Pirellulaceae bacterium]